MKITIVSGVVTAVSQTKREAQRLVSLALETGEFSETSVKHKKHLYTKTCEFCHQGFKGAIGLGIHKNKCPKRVLKEPKPVTLTEDNYGGVHVQRENASVLLGR